MTVSEIFAKISARQVESMMTHNSLADYYDFLGLMGFKRLHEYYFLCEAAEMRGIHRYFINHYNMLLPEKQVEVHNATPSAWYEHKRREVGIDTKRSAIKNGAEKWCDWEHASKSMYEQCYCDLCDIGEIAAANKVKFLVCAADMQAKCADRLFIKLKGMDYDMAAIYVMQEEMHEEYDQKSREIGVTMC